MLAWRSSRLAAASASWSGAGAGSSCGCSGRLLLGEGGLFSWLWALCGRLRSSKSEQGRKCALLAGDEGLVLLSSCPWRREHDVVVVVELCFWQDHELLPLISSQLLDLDSPQPHFAAWTSPTSTSPTTLSLLCSSLDLSLNLRPSISHGQVHSLQQWRPSPRHGPSQAPAGWSEFPMEPWLSWTPASWPHLEHVATFDIRHSDISHDWTNYSWRQIFGVSEPKVHAEENDCFYSCCGFLTSIIQLFLQSVWTWSSWDAQL